MNKTMTWIRKYILNKIVSRAVRLLGVFLAFYIIVIDSNNSLTDFILAFLFFILPPLYYLAYVNYLNKKLGIWLKCFQAILLLGAAGTWIFLIYVIIEEGLPDIYDFEIFMYIYILVLPIAFLEAFFDKSKSKFKFPLSFLKFFLKKIVWVPITSIVSFAVVWTLILLVNIGGISNFLERVDLERTVFLDWSYVKENKQQENYCNNLPSEFLVGVSFGEYNEFFFKNNLQFWDYFDVPQRDALDRRDPDVLQESHKKAKSFLPFFKGDPKAQIQQAYLHYDKKNLRYNWCQATRWIMRAAHQNDKVARGLLIGYPIRFSDSISAFLKTSYASDYGSNLFFNDSKNYYTSSNYKKIILNMDLNNPVNAYYYALILDDRIKWAPNDFWRGNKLENIEYDFKALEFLEKSAEAGYIPAMSRLAAVYSIESYFNEKNCSKKIKMHEDLASQKSILDTWNLMSAYMGRNSGFEAKQIYHCLGDKPNFAKAFKMITNAKNWRRPDSDRKSLGWREALFYLNGWSIKQDYLKAFEIFSECKEELICNSYYSFMILKGMGTDQDEEFGKNIFIKYLDGVSCDGKTFEFVKEDVYDIDDPELKAKQEKSKIRNTINNQVLQCIKNTNKEKFLSIVEDKIRNRLSELYMNEELLATLNIMGEPQ